MKQEHIALLNLILCTGVFWSCVCRLNAQPSKVFRTVRAKYVLLLAGSSLSGLQPTLLGTWPSYSDLFFSAVVLVFLALSMNKWRKPYDAQVVGERRVNDENKQ